MFGIRRLETSDGTLWQFWLFFYFHKGNLHKFGVDYNEKNQIILTIGEK